MIKFFKKKFSTQTLSFKRFGLKQDISQNHLKATNPPLLHTTRASVSKALLTRKTHEKGSK